MREIFTSGTVGGALGNQCFYPEILSPIEVLGNCTLLDQSHTLPLFLATPLVSKLSLVAAGRALR